MVKSQTSSLVKIYYLRGRKWSIHKWWWNLNSGVGNGQILVLFSGSWISHFTMRITKFFFWPRNQANPRVRKHHFRSHKISVVWNHKSHVFNFKSVGGNYRFRSYGFSNFFLWTLCHMEQMWQAILSSRYRNMIVSKSRTNFVVWIQIGARKYVTFLHRKYLN
jgi:hypothetical protein